MKLWKPFKELQAQGNSSHAAAVIEDACDKLKIYRGGVAL